MTAPLKPCPFCGGKAELVRPALGGRPYVCCVENFCAGPKSTTEAAVTAWNTRADAPELLALVGIAKLAIAAVVEIQTYKQPDDPWTENALTMGELDAFDFDVDAANAAVAKWEALQ